MPEILEAAEATLDEVARLIGALLKLWRVTLLDLFGMTAWRRDRRFRRESRRYVVFVTTEGRHGWREFPRGRGGGNIGVLARSEMKCARSTIRVAQRVEFRGPSPARAADRPFMLPLFRRSPSGAP